MNTALLRCDRCHKTTEAAKTDLLTMRKEYQWYRMLVSVSSFAHGDLMKHQDSALGADLCYDCYAALREFWSYFHDSKNAETLFDDKVKALEKDHSGALAERDRQWKGLLERTQRASESAKNAWENETQIRIAKALRARDKKSRTARKKRRGAKP